MDHVWYVGGGRGGVDGGGRGSRPFCSQRQPPSMALGKPLLSWQRGRMTRGGGLLMLLPLGEGSKVLRRRRLLCRGYVSCYRCMLLTRRGRLPHKERRHVFCLRQSAKRRASARRRGILLVVGILSCASAVAGRRRGSSRRPISRGRGRYHRCTVVHRRWIPIGWWRTGEKVLRSTAVADRLLRLVDDPVGWKVQEKGAHSSTKRERGRERKRERNSSEELIFGCCGVMCKSAFSENAFQC